MPEQVRTDSTLCDGQAQAWGEKILELNPDVFGVGFLFFMFQVQSTQARVFARAKGDL